MTRDEYLEVLATEPATGTQVGAIIGEFERLGVADRAERLAITAKLLGLEHVGSTTDLVMGQAGQLVAMLRSIDDRSELPEVAAPAATRTRPTDDEADDQADERITWPEAITRIIAMIYVIWNRDVSAGKPIGYSAASIGLTSREGRQNLSRN